MKIETTALDGVLLLRLEPHVDERGYFARAFCRDELVRAGVTFEVPQVNLSRNDAQYTLRGMHWQDPPYAEAKVVRCVRGSIVDVAADIRPQSPTYRQWVAVTLDAEKGDALLIPEGYAHGFITMEPNTDVFYLMGRSYVPGKARGFRYDDPAFAIEWPAAPSVVGAADLAWPTWNLQQQA